MAGFAPEVLALLRKLGAGGIPIGAGKVFWVDLPPNGDNDKVGTSPDEPFATITYALTKCEIDRNDYIIVLNCWQQESAWPITVSVEMAHIIGLALPSNPWPKMQPATDHPVFRVATNHVEIAGFDLSGGATALGCIDLYTGQGAYIHDCWFGHQQAGGTPLHGIVVEYNAHGARIERNRFFGDGAGAKGTILSNGIEFAYGGCMEIEILNNIFHKLAIGINVVDADEFVIAGNKFTCLDLANGEAITLDAACTEGLIEHNASMFGNAQNDYSHNPYRELGAPNNHWGRNYRGNAVIEPVTV